MSLLQLTLFLFRKKSLHNLKYLFFIGQLSATNFEYLFKNFSSNNKVLAVQAGVANAGYVQLAHLVMDSQKIGFIETQTWGSKQKVWNLNHYTMKLD